MSDQPNILVIMADQLSPAFLRAYGHKLVRTPHIDALAAGGVVFENAYCASPLCSPSRASFMAGLLPSRTRVYDNAAEFAADIPTYAHHLRRLGYRTVLSGKMHFCGPDQMHGFEQRLTTDIYPADFGWTPDWDHPEARPSWYHNMSSVTQAGLAVRTNQLDFDDEVTFAAEREIYDKARGIDNRPLLLVASLTHPHDPYAITREFFDLYAQDDIDMPAPAIPPHELDPHSQRLRHVCAMDAQKLTEAQIRTARRAYYGEISYVDRNVGRLLKALGDCGLRDDTIVIVLADHGEMLGDKGLWYKMSFFENSARVPLIVNAPGRFAPRRVAAAASLLDVTPTLVDLAGGDAGAIDTDGRSLKPHLEGGSAPDETMAEYLAEGAIAPIVMIRRGPWKFIHSPADPDQLYDLANDPGERRNLATHARHSGRVAEFRDEVARRWRLDALDAEVRASQRRRRLVDAALNQGEPKAWDFQPFKDAAKSYVRNTIPLDDLEASARFPRVSP
ncbi:MAG: choline-sulfatase [Pseudomonadota bacterium]|nr:choline-sulfatase [Pseudomonadota bacterium]